MTLLVGIIFFWFWFQGPLNKPNQLTGFESNSSEFLIPIFINDVVQQQKEFGLVGSEQTGHRGVMGFGLVGQVKTNKPYGLIADPHHQPSMIADVGEAMQQRAKQFHPEAITRLKLALDMFYIENRDSGGRYSGLYLETTGLTEHIKGYAGAITLGLSLTPQGEVDKVHYINSQETSSYLRKIDNSGFYQKFTGIVLNGNEHQIDAVSGATISTQAMAKTITGLLNKASESPLSLYMDEDIEGMVINASLKNEWLIQITLIFLFFLYFWQPWLLRTRRRTTCILLLSTLYIGFYLNNSFTYISLLHPFLGVTVSMLVGIYCALALLGAIWDNNTYCKFVCPYGNAQRLITRLLPHWRQSFFMPSKWVKRVRTLITLMIVIGVIWGQSQWASYELFPDLFGLEIASLWFAIALASILVTSVYPMVWCRLLCPTGEVLDWISDLVAPARNSNKTHNKQSLRSCKQCAPGCSNAKGDTS